MESQEVVMSVASIESEIVIAPCDNKAIGAYRTISEVAEELGLPQYVLRFWESRFPALKPLKRAGGRRYYRPNDVELVNTIRDLLYNKGFTIKGAQKYLKANGLVVENDLQNNEINAEDDSNVECNEIELWLNKKEQLKAEVLALKDELIGLKEEILNLNKA